MLLLMCLNSVNIIECLYIILLKNWFGDGIEQKIVESAIVFWFKDADCKAENKVVEYLGEY